MTDLELVHSYLATAEASARTARLSLERLMTKMAAAEQARAESESLTPERKVPPTFGDSVTSHKPQEE